MFEDINADLVHCPKKLFPTLTDNVEESCESVPKPPEYKSKACFQKNYFLD